VTELQDVLDYFDGVNELSAAKSIDLFTWLTDYDTLFPDRNIADDIRLWINRQRHSEKIEYTQAKVKFFNRYLLTAHEVYWELEESDPLGEGIDRNSQPLYEEYNLIFHGNSCEFRDDLREWVQTKEKK
jgi:hypothetical protein